MTQEKKAGLFIGICALVIVALLVFARGLGSPSEADAQAFQRTEQAIRAYYASQNKAPDALADLPVEADIYSDRTGQSLVYQVEGSKVTLTALGGDQKPGGIMFKADREHVFYLTE